MVTPPGAGGGGEGWEVCTFGGVGFRGWAGDLAEGGDLFEGELVGCGGGELVAVGGGGDRVGGGRGVLIGGGGGDLLGGIGGGGGDLQHDGGIFLSPINVALINK